MRCAGVVGYYAYVFFYVCCVWLHVLPPAGVVYCIFLGSDFNLSEDKTIIFV